MRRVPRLVQFLLPSHFLATLRCHIESKFTLFHNTGALWLLWGKETEKREQSGYERESEKRGCGLNQPSLLGIEFVFDDSAADMIYAQCQSRSTVFTELLQLKSQTEAVCRYSHRRYIFN